jgi:hypothetical protein
MTLIGNWEGKLHVQRQVEDYAFRSIEFEAMSFLTFTVETYEHRLKMEGERRVEENEDETEHSTTNQNGRYLIDHPKSDTHYRICR